MTPTPGQIYTHYKRGGRYKILSLGYFQSNTIDDEEKVVIYEQQYETLDYPKGTIWVRPVKMFTELCQHQEKDVLRFQLLDN